MKDFTFFLPRSKFNLACQLPIAGSHIFHIQAEASPTFGDANAIFSVFIDPIRNQFLNKEMNNDNDLNLHLHHQMSGWRRY